MFVACLSESFLSEFLNSRRKFLYEVVFPKLFFPKVFDFNVYICQRVEFVVVASLFSVHRMISNCIYHTAKEMKAYTDNRNSDKLDLSLSRSTRM